MVKNFIILVLALMMAFYANAGEPDTIHYYHAETDKPYDEVLAELEIAITEQNFRITGHSRVGKVIRTRDNIKYPDYDTIQFCNLTHAKKMLDIAPDSVRHMPCNVVTYVHGGKIVIKTRLLPVNTGNNELNRLSTMINNKLKQIVDFAAEQ